MSASSPEECHPEPSTSTQPAVFTQRCAKGERSAPLLPSVSHSHLKCPCATRGQRFRAQQDFQPLPHVTGHNFLAAADWSEQIPRAAVSLKLDLGSGWHSAECRKNKERTDSVLSLILIRVHPRKSAVRFAALCRGALALNRIRLRLCHQRTNTEEHRGEQYI